MNDPDVRALTMPIYKKTRLIHIHIPKTGGTAIERFFHEIGDMKWGKESWVGEECINDRWYEYQHLSLAELQSLSNSAYETYDSFAVVRNPYSRLLSDYIWRQKIRKAYPEVPSLAYSSIDAFIDAIPKDINSHWEAHICGADKKLANFLIHIRPQYQYIGNSEEKISVDKIIKFEEIDAGFDGLLSKYNMENDKIKKTKSRNILEYYNKKTIECVNRLYEKDFRMLSYKIL